jgi:hypothetical protein
MRLGGAFGIAVALGGACSAPEPSSSVVAVPTYASSAGARPAAGLTGRLIYEEPCFTVTDERGSTYVLIWPSGFSARRAGDFVWIVGPAGEVWTQSRLSFEGGVFEGESAQVLRTNISNLPAACDREPFWLVGEVSVP